MRLPRGARSYSTARPQRRTSPSAAVARPTPPAVAPPVPAIVLESRSAVVVNKPAGAALQGAHGSPARRNWDALLVAIRQKPGCEQAVPVHRLDKAVSGALLLARNPVFAARLSKQFHNNDIRKVYLAVVHGQLKPGYRGEIDARLRVDDDRVRVCGPDEGVDAKTTWECLAASPSFSLLRLEPATGRKHQLRVHCADVLKAPIVGDFKLAPKAPHAAALSELSLPLDNVLLHASSLSFYEWEKSGKRATMTASAPPLAAFVRFCRAHRLGLPTAEE
ncbi:hypothetical protein JCM10207_005286 [Rhodosporidiobolus poonsookiae]